jgi:hypothetical protein
MCYPPQPSLSSPLADGNHGSQAPGNYLVPPSMASPSSCLTTQQIYSNYPSPYYRSMLAGSQQSSMSSYYGTILPPPSHHSSAFYGTFYNPNSPSVYPSSQPPINPINYYSPSLYMQNHETMWPNSNSNSQPAPAKRSYSYETSNISQLPACSKVSSSIMPINSLPESRTTALPEETSTLTLEPLPECSSSAVESAAKETDYMCVELDRPASKCETADSPGDDESSVIDKESLEIKRRIIGNWFSPCLLNIEANGNILLTAFSFNEYIMLPEMRYFIIIDKNGKIIKKIEIEGLEGLKKFHDIISLNNKIIASDDTKLKIFEFV